MCSRKSVPRARGDEPEAREFKASGARSAVEKAGYTGLAEGAKASFDVVMNRGKESAKILKIR